jgi:hypothetical protein
MVPIEQRVILEQMRSEQLVVHLRYDGVVRTVHEYVEDFVGLSVLSNQGPLRFRFIVRPAGGV